LIDEHQKNPGLRLLQNELAKSITTLVHGRDNYESAKEASAILFKKGIEAVQSMKNLTAELFNDIFEGVPQKEVSISNIENGITIIDALVSNTGFLKSNGEVRRALKENAISVNKTKVKEGYQLSTSDLIADRYILLQRGKKTYFLIKTV
jgi:tyrosyl-tRNA synthetase